MFESPDFVEIYRTMQVDVKVTQIEHDPDNATRPRIMFKGSVGGVHTMVGTVQMTPDDQIKWRFVSDHPP